MRKRKRIGIIQSNYIPWMGYFDFIDDCDLFILFDCLQYTKRDWRNRNRIKSEAGVRWVTVPVLDSRELHYTIDETPIKNNINWIEEHKKWLTLCYQEAPFFAELAPSFFSVLEAKAYHTISELNFACIQWVLQILEITTPLMSSRELNAQGKKTDRLIDIIKKVNGTEYLSGPSAASYIETDKFKDNNISLLYKTYQYEPYPQIHEPFTPGLSILDLLFNCGYDSKTRLKSGSSLKVEWTPKFIDEGIH